MNWLNDLRIKYAWADYIMVVEAYDCKPIQAAPCLQESTEAIKKMLHAIMKADHPETPNYEIVMYPVKEKINREVTSIRLSKLKTITPLVIEKEPMASLNK